MLTNVRLGFTARRKPSLGLSSDVRSVLTEIKLELPPLKSASLARLVCFLDVWFVFLMYLIICSEFSESLTINNARF